MNTINLKEIKEAALLKFKQKKKHASDILTNELSNSFLKTYFGCFILEKLKLVMDQNSNTFDKFSIANLLIEECLQFKQIQSKQDLHNTIETFLNKSIFKSVNKYQARWNIYESLIREFNLEQQLQNFLINILNQNSDKYIGFTQVLSLLCLIRFQSQLSMSIQETWEFTFKENFPKSQSLKNIERKQRICEKQYKKRAIKQEKRGNNNNSQNIINQQQLFDLGQELFENNQNNVNKIDFNQVQEFLQSDDNTDGCKKILLKSKKIKKNDNNKIQNKKKINQESIVHSNDESLLHDQENLSSRANTSDANNNQNSPTYQQLDHVFNSDIQSGEQMQRNDNFQYLNFTPNNTAYSQLDSSQDIDIFFSEPVKEFKNIFDIQMSNNQGYNNINNNH